MKKIFGIFKSTSAWMLLLTLAMALFGVNDVSMAAGVAGTDGAGIHISGGNPLNTEIIKTDSPDLLLPDIDDRVTKISPYKNPIDQLARLVGRKMKSNGMEYKHYSVDISPIKGVVSVSLANQTAATSELNVTNHKLFNITDTITVKGVKGYLEDGTTLSVADLMLYIAGKSVAGVLTVVPVNGKLVVSEKCVPNIAQDAEVYLLGTAAAEGDIRSYQNAALPLPETGYCQIYKMEVGETTIAQMTKKEVDWSLDDQIEIGVTKLRSAIERSSLIGVKGKTVVPNKNIPIYTTQGIYWQITKSIQVPSSPDNADLIDMSKTIFTGQSGSNKKILLMGSAFNAAISKTDLVTKQLQSNNTEVIWGITWKKISTNFGELVSLPYDLLDALGRSDEAIVIDPDFLDKWTLIPFGSKDIDTKTNGVFDGDINVTTEISSICLRYKNAHARLKLF